jgi:hypothetical protein
MIVGMQRQFIGRSRNIWNSVGDFVANEIQFEERALHKRAMN